MTQEELIRHMEWADASVWRSVLASAEASADGELKERLFHIHLVQGVFPQVWKGEELKVRQVTEFEDLAAVLGWARSTYRELLRSLAGLDAARRSEAVSLPWRRDLEERFGDVPPTLLGETITQVILHTMHHRAQVNTRLRALGGEPPLVDYIAWVWQGRPAPEWPSGDPGEPAAE